VVHYSPGFFDLPFKGRGRIIKDDLEKIVQDLAALGDPWLRTRGFRERLGKMPLPYAAEAIELVCRKVREGDPRYEWLLLDLLDREGWSSALGETWVQNIQAELSKRGCLEALRLFQDEETGEPADEERIRPDEPLGLRVSLARRASSRLLERLLADPHPRVIKTLLGNPRLTEAEVLKVASSRRSSPEILETIARDKRWISRYRVKLALLNNPRTPFRISLGLLPFLMEQDLKELAGSTALPSKIREKAHSLIEDRRTRAIL